MLQSLNAIICQRRTQTAVEMLAQDRIKSLIDQRGFATTTYACYRNHLPKRECHIHALEVVTTATV